MNKTLTTIAIVFALIVAGMVTYLLVNKWHQKQMALARQQAQNECLQVIHKMDADVKRLQGQLNAEQKMRPGSEEYPTVFGTPAPGPDSGTQPVDCKKVESQMLSFFKYLDGRNYIAKRNLKGGSERFFRQCASLLMASPPVNVGEMQNMYRLVKNVTHFYRVLGRKRLFLAKEILTNEDRIIEPAMALFYDRLVVCHKPLPGDKKPLPIERLYDYAGYFLNTLGGRSYLLRRESKLRMLVSYYSILIVDRANDEKFNRYGIDIRPYIDYLFYDISNQKGLAYRQRYLTHLTALRNKYM